MNTVKIELEVSVIRAARVALTDRANECRTRARGMSDPNLRSLIERQAKSYDRDALAIVRALAEVGFNAR